MPRGRKPLDPEQKAHRRQAALAKYALNHRAALAEADEQIVRQQKARAHTGTKFGGQIRGYIEQQGLEAFDKKTTRKFLAKTQRRHEGQMPVRRLSQLPKKLPRPKSRAGTSDEEEEDTSEDEEEEDTAAPANPRAYFPGRAGAECENGCGEVSCEGCACICSGSSTWMDHDHYLQRQQVPLAAPLLCAPVYMPDPGDEDKQKHSASPNGWFYGLVSGNLVGVVSSSETLQRILRDNPNAHYIKVNTWPRLLELWYLECREYHNHEDEGPQTPMLAAQPQVWRWTPEYEARRDERKMLLAELRYLGSEADAAHALRAAAPPAPELSVKAPHGTGLIELAYKAERLLLGDDEAEYKLAEWERTRRSGEMRGRLAELARQDLADGPAPHPEPVVISDDDDDDGEAQGMTTIDGGVSIHDADAGAIAALEAQMENAAITDGEGGVTELMYGVSGHNRIFHDRARAMAAFKKTPGADLLFTYEDAVVAAFIEDEAAQKKV
ncbi:hypothetical protein DFH09DRAFT_1074796 [Mycena vulgaris]|nr:hypothetical protein DFH09DRAFT_1074796 [Mycena vulgaris]